MGYNSAKNCGKLICNNPDLDLVSINAYAKFVKIHCFVQDMSKEQSSDINQGP